MSVAGMKDVKSSEKRERRRRGREKKRKERVDAALLGEMEKMRDVWNEKRW